MYFKKELRPEYCFHIYNMKRKYNIDENNELDIWSDPEYYSGSDSYDWNSADAPDDEYVDHDAIYFTSGLDQSAYEICASSRRVYCLDLKYYLDGLFLIPAIEAAFDQLPCASLLACMDPSHGCATSSLHYAYTLLNYLQTQSYCKASDTFISIKEHFRAIEYRIGQIEASFQTELSHESSKIGEIEYNKIRVMAKKCEAINKVIAEAESKKVLHIASIKMALL